MKTKFIVSSDTFGFDTSSPKIYSIRATYEELFGANRPFILIKDDDKTQHIPIQGNYYVLEDAYLYVRWKKPLRITSKEMPPYDRSAIDHWFHEHKNTVTYAKTKTFA